MKIYISTLFHLTILSVLSSCVIDPFDTFKEGEWNNERSILTIKFENQVGLEQIVRLDDTRGRVNVGINTGGIPDLKNVKITSLVLSYGAVSSVNVGDALNFENENNSATFSVTSPTGKAREYVVTADPFVETILGTYQVAGLVVWGGTGPEFGGGAILDMTSKPWVWKASGGPEAELDNSITLELEGFTDNGNSYGKIINQAGEDGAYADFYQVGFGGFQASDVNHYYRKIPVGEGTWERNYTTGQVTFTFSDGSTSSGQFVEGPVTENVGHGQSREISSYAFAFNLAGTDDWDNIYSDYDKFVKRPRRYWIDLTKLD